ncbi:pre-mrna-splicing factor clf1 [Phaffia rhodozyma]|uniref:Pre-mRNA-splicing factor CLF1 n=1 Tax=Phaffia rhodozyma TaxID=264483 RepID=A0A0F7SQ13_PHARH|nr:pre-mrna-splicing factor clf1 [Phaffia rhodozyma]
MSTRQGDRAPRVKNRAPAAVQITAEQLLREAQERQESGTIVPKQKVEDLEELNEYRGRKRQEYENRIRYSRSSIHEWRRYATWEASQGEYDRARSVFERALDVDPSDIQLWSHYCETELKARNIAHARNLYDRAVTLLPRVDSLWLKFIHLEELLGNIAGARTIFERWMKWEPDDRAWGSYVKLELRYNEFDRASGIYERWIGVRPEPKNWIVWSRFEEDRGKIEKAREVFQTALEFFGDSEEEVEKAQSVFAAFARMETRLKEFDRARVIYKFALSRLPRSKSQTLYAAFTKFEKQHGTRAGVESTVLGKRRIQYEEELSHDANNYDAWISYARLEEDAYRSAREDGQTTSAEELSPAKVRDVYERAVAQVPPGNEKRHWRRYVFLWLFYAAFEEVESKDYERARQVYKAALQLIPHRTFTFAKLWIQFAYFELRQKDVQAAKKLLGTAIGMCPKEKLFKVYIEFRTKLYEFDDVRTIYMKYLEFDPSNTGAWVRWAQFEAELGDLDRARYLFDLGTTQELDMPEVLWKAWIDFEFEQGERERTRMLYEALLEKTGHVKVWIAYALFEVQAMTDEDGEPLEDEGGDPELARKVLDRGYTDLRNRGFKEERVVLLEAWKEFEKFHGTPEELKAVEEKMPRVVKKWKKLEEANGALEEYWDMIFPDDEREANPASFKVLQMAHAWKQAQAAAAGGKSLFDDSDDSDDDDDDDDNDDEEEGDATKEAEPVPTTEEASESAVDMEE